MVDFFLTAYDQSDLPGTRIDPLGFERGYLYLADKILPGMTNVAARPLYFGLLCAGISLAKEDEQLSPLEFIKRKRDTLLRLERFWALSNVLASETGEADGVRGLRYAQAKSRELARSQAVRVDPKYPTPASSYVDNPSRMAVPSLQASTSTVQSAISF